MTKQGQEPTVTEDQIRDVRDDIAFMRALAAEGQHAPLLGGSILASAGFIYGVGSLLHWSVATRLVALTSLAFPFIWLGATLLFLLVLTLLTRRYGRPGATTPVNRATRAAWSAVGMSIFAIGAACAVIIVQTRSEAVMAIFPSMIFGLYGLGWAVAAAMTGKAWLRWVGIGSWVFAPILAWFSSGPELYLFYAAGLFLFMGLPGLALARQEPSDIV